MDRLNGIVQSDVYKRCIAKMIDYEKNRIYCKHNMEHFLDTARIAYIIVLEKGVEIKKDVVYAAALLHDIGRIEQYEKGTPHELASAQLAEEILKDTEYKKEESDIIINAILNHRSNNQDNENTDNILGSILYKSDKVSRMCFNCSAQSTCNWSDQKKNMKIKY